VIFRVALGKKRAKSKPIKMGRPSKSNICSSIGMNGITNCGISCFILIKRLYIDPQKKKFKGVTIGEKVVVIAVREIDNATFPFDNDDKKFEILPPGHDAINIIPNAIIGVITGLSNNAIRNVTAGRANHCKNIPRAIDLGFLTTSIIVRGLILNATPNMTKARIIFTIIIPSSPKFIVKEFKDSNCSFISLPMFICANI
jgi:hypothetical protein